MAFYWFRLFEKLSCIEISMPGILNKIRCILIYEKTKRTKTSARHSRNWAIYIKIRKIEYLMKSSANIEQRWLALHCSLCYPLNNANEKPIEKQQQQQKNTKQKFSSLFFIVEHRKSMWQNRISKMKSEE